MFADIFDVFEQPNIYGLCADFKRKLKVLSRFLFNFNENHIKYQKLGTHQNTFFDPNCFPVNRK